MTSTNSLARLEDFTLTIQHRWNVTVNDDEPAALDFTGTKTAALARGMTVVWQQPKQSLTLIIETAFTTNKVPFKVNFDNNCLDDMSSVHHIIDGEEIEKLTNEERASLNSDSKYQVVVKLDAPEGNPDTCEIVCAFAGRKNE